MFNSMIATALEGGALIGVAFMPVVFIFWSLPRTDKWERSFIRNPFFIAAILPAYILVLNIFREDKKLQFLELFALLMSSFAVSATCCFLLDIWFKRVRRLEQQEALEMAYERLVGLFLEMESQIKR